MDPKLQKLIRQLQDEKCPPAVLDRVAQRIAQENAPAPARSWRPALAWSLSVVAIAGLLGAAVLRPWQARRDAQRVAAELAAAQMRAQRALVMQQTQLAFGYIGQALLRAAAHTGNAFSKDVVPPLRNSFETVKNKVTDPI